MKRSVEATAAAVLEILASVPYFIGSVAFFIVPTFLPQKYGGTQIWGPTGFVVWFPFAVPLLAGGICAIVRRAWAMALIGAIWPLVWTVLVSPWGYTGIGTVPLIKSLSPDIRETVVVLVYLFMVVAGILLLLSRKEFKGRQSFSEHLYGPPKGWHGPED